VTMDLPDGICPRCGCRDTAFHFGTYQCSCCGLVFTSEEGERDAETERKAYDGCCETY
jgi:ribosomal protein L37E